MIKEYTTSNVKKVGEPDQYGNNGFSVIFAEEKDSVFMRAKKEPVEGGTEYGEITEETGKSGKSYRKFTRKQREDYNAPAQTSTPSAQPKQNFVDRDDSITRQSALKSAVATGEKDLDKIIALAEDFYVWLKGENKNEEEIPVPEPQGEVTDLDDEINLDDIPF